MAKKSLNKIFLSASIPLPERHPRFYDTADFIAIRDSVKALATVAIPNLELVWGGHPSITPLIRHVIEKMGGESNRHVTLYQSRYFEGSFPKSNISFENIIYTPAVSTLEESLLIMREEMIGKNQFVAGVFIGGMKGILDEYEIFGKFHPDALCIPVASTGAAARALFNILEGMNFKPNDRLLNDYAYISLFKELLGEYLDPIAGH